jgi:hypothetical protein
MLTIYNPYHQEKRSLSVTLSKNKKWATTEPINLSALLCRCGSPECTLEFSHGGKPLGQNILLEGESLRYELPV